MSTTSPVLELGTLPQDDLLARAQRAMDRRLPARTRGTSLMYTALHRMYVAGFLPALA